MHIIIHSKRKTALKSCLQLFLVECFVPNYEDSIDFFRFVFKASYFELRLTLQMPVCWLAAFFAIKDSYLICEQTFEKDSLIRQVLLIQSICIWKTRLVCKIIEFEIIQMEMGGFQRAGKRKNKKSYRKFPSGSILVWKGQREKT